MLTPAVPAPQRRVSGATSLQAVPERLLPATPAIGPLSYESTVPMLRRLWRRLKPLQTLPVCL